MNEIVFGDCLGIMRYWSATGVKVQTCVTSPPYYGLRDYGVDGQFGLEPTPNEYVDNMVEVFRCVRDLLTDDGTLWLNIGDSYAAQRGGSHQPAETLAGGKSGKMKNGDTVNRDRHAGYNPTRNAAAIGLKHKDLIGIPWMLAFALRADGWYLRQDIIWHKPNPMPESVTDRCTKAHEYIFLMSKSERYFIDPVGLKEPAIGAMAGNTKPTKGARAYADGATEHRTSLGLHDWAARQRSARDSFKRAEVIPNQTVGTHRPDRDESEYDTATRNRRSVWTVATRPYKGAHFATFPPALIEPCVLAGSRIGDIVLDPFMGSGTTAAVAAQHGRKYLGCELNLEYASLQKERLS